MERPLQDNGGDFENGIFSGASPVIPGGIQNDGAGRQHHGCAAPNDSRIPAQARRTVPPFPASGPSFCPAGPYFCPCMRCPWLKKDGREKNGSLPVIITGFVLLAILFLAFLIMLFSIVCIMVWKNQAPSFISAPWQFTAPYEVPAVPETQRPDEPEPDTSYENGAQSRAAAESVIPDEAKKAPHTGGGETQEGSWYGELRDTVGADLDYSVKWKNYTLKEKNGNVTVMVDYPVIHGDMPNKDTINKRIAEETKYFEDFYNEYSLYMTEEDTISVYSEGFVTCMDANTMSVVFEESLSTNFSDRADRGIYCINIDVANGVVLENSGVINVDDAFVRDFRSRSSEQKPHSVIDYLTDQELAFYLENAVMFYTPLGLEVGVNLGESYVTVTYGDDEKYVRKY